MSDYKSELANLAKQLRNPLRLRVISTALVLALGYVAIVMPLNQRIDQTTRLLQSERKSQALAEEVRTLRAQADMFAERIPQDTDTNEWVQYLLEGTRKFPLKLINLDSKAPQRVGPYEAVELRIELSGMVQDLDSFLHWLESNERLIRVDGAKLEPARQDRSRKVMQLTLLGLKSS